jgi:hypothetical protein
MLKRGRIWIGDDELRNKHSIRFRRIGGERYPRRVVEAYAGDLCAPAKASDEQVAEQVREWEIAQGIEPVNWAKFCKKRAKLWPPSGLR